MIQDIFSAYSIICDVKEIARKQKLNQRENYQIIYDTTGRKSCLHHDINNF